MLVMKKSYQRQKTGVNFECFQLFTVNSITHSNITPVRQLNIILLFLIIVAWDYHVCIFTRFIHRKSVFLIALGSWRSVFSTSHVDMCSCLTIKSTPYWPFVRKDISMSPLLDKQVITPASGQIHSYRAKYQPFTRIFDPLPMWYEYELSSKIAMMITFTYAMVSKLIKLHIFWTNANMFSTELRNFYS